MRKIPLILLAAVLALTLMRGAPFAAESCQMTFRPNQIDIGATYNGAILSVSGTVPEGCSAVVRILGEREDEVFKQKGKALGLLWMNMAAVTIHSVPRVVLLGLDADTYENGGPGWQNLGLGFESFRDEEAGDVFDDFLKLKERDGYYDVEQAVVEYSTAEDGSRQYKAEIAVPSSLHKGVYDVQVFAVRDGQVVCEAEHELHVELTGFPALLARVAFNHSLLYGILATIVAILAGLFMSLVFKDRGGAH